MTNQPPASIRAWAERILASEALQQRASDVPLFQALRVSEKLRVSLTRFVGADGFTALLRRALALARANVPALSAVVVTPEGRLEANQGTFPARADEDLQAATAITAHLLGLLATFIGEPLTRRIVNEAWPETSLDE